MPARKKRWTEAVVTIDGSRDYVILENADAAKRRDDVLVKDFWPIIHDKLRTADTPLTRTRRTPNRTTGVTVTKLRYSPTVLHAS